MNNYTKTIVIGLDGVLCQTEGIDYINSVPNEDRIEIVNELYEQNYEIIIDSDRGSDRLGGQVSEYYKLTQEQLSYWGVQYHKLRVGVKFKADVILDEKAVTWDYAEGFLDKESKTDG